MDISRRLWGVVWLLLAGLWGILVYQYLGPESQAPVPRNRFVPRKIHAAVARAAQVPRGALTDDSLALVQPAPGVVGAAPPSSPGEAAKPLPVPLGPPAIPVEPSAPAQIPAPATYKNSQQPEVHGFVETDIEHFKVYSEGEEAPKSFLHLLESLHGNLMLDLANFAPWKDTEKVSVYFFKDAETYRGVTGRPAWSGGCSSVPDREVYVYQSSEIQGILAHELTHIYYDGFFLSGHPDPLWLSEGMATLMQVERGLAAPAWLGRSFAVIRGGGYWPFSRLMAVESLRGRPASDVEVWYTESFSVVRLLLRLKFPLNFYRFSVFIRDGKTVSEALLKAYGLPFRDTEDLQDVWLFNLKNRSNLGARAPVRYQIPQL